MTRLRHLPTLVVALALVAPSGAALAQEEVETSTAPTAVTETADARFEELRALVPEFLAGLPLREELQIAAGEELAGQMSEDEWALFEEMLASQGRPLRDYAAANVLLPISDTRIAVIQVHRVSGIEASETMEDWVQIVGLNAQHPRRTDEVIGGRDVARISDDARPGFPPLNLFASGDVVWMVVAENEALVEEAVRALSAASAPAEPAE